VVVHGGLCSGVLGFHELVCSLVCGVCGVV